MPKYTIDSPFRLGMKVYLITDPEQAPRMLIGFVHNLNGTQYTLVCGTEESDHFANEISKTRDFGVLPKVDEEEEMD